MAKKHNNEGLILVTGMAGFIGMHVAARLAATGFKVIGIDNLNDYYEVSLKYARLNQLGIRTESIIDGELLMGYDGITFVKGAIECRADLDRIFTSFNVRTVIHLAAQAGVRYSIDAPEVYVKSNIEGFFNILECCRYHKIEHLVYASSSSVYGLNGSIPFKESDQVDHPVSFYAATKKSNELMAHTYSHLFNIPTTGLRFFTVYGPWGRPDMALFKFTHSILNGGEIDVYNHGKMSRDFTYIDDIVEGVIRVALKAPDSRDCSETPAPYRILNIGRNEPVSLDQFIQAIESATGSEARRNDLPIQPGDVERTYADVSQLVNLTGYAPKVSVSEGVSRFVEWFRKFYGI